MVDLNDDLKKVWSSAVDLKIKTMADNSSTNKKVKEILYQWHKSITTGIKYNYNPDVSGFYSIFMTHGTWFKQYQEYLGSSKNRKANLSNLSENSSILHLDKNFQMLATDIDVPDINKEYQSTSSRLRNSFVASRDYFVSDFGINYIETEDLTIMKYHEAWHKFINLIKEGEIEPNVKSNPGSYFVDVPYANAIWVAVFKPFTTDIKLLIKIVGVMPVNLPIKSVVGNRSQSKMTTINMMYKSSNIFYKFYDGLEDVNSDTGELATSFKEEVLNIQNIS